LSQDTALVPMMKTKLNTRNFESTLGHHRHLTFHDDLLGLEV